MFLGLPKCLISMKMLTFMIGLSMIRIMPKIKCELPLYKDN